MSQRTIPFTDGMKVGLGYNRLTGDVRPFPAVLGKSSAVTHAGGQQVTVDCTIIQDVETLHKTLGITVDAGGSYMGFSGSSKTNYASSFDFSSFSIYVVVKASVENVVETIDSPVFSDDAIELLMNNNPERFRERFGDSYIAGIKNGGEYFAIFQLTSSNETEKEDVAQQVQLAFGTPGAGAELSTTIKTTMAHSTSHLAVNIHVFRQGTISTADLNLDDIMQTAKQFPLDVAGDKAFPFGVLIQDYAGLKNPNDKFNYIEIQNRQDVLEDLAKKRFEFLALRDDIRYILKHSEEFQNADNTPVDREKLGKELDEIVNAINTMENEAKNCARDAGQCKFSLFDSAKFTVPVLSKKTEDLLLTKGSFMVDQDPLAVMLRKSLPDEGSKRGFNIAFGFAGTQTLPGPGKDRFRESLPLDERDGFSTAVLFFTTRNRNIDFVNAGVKIADNKKEVSNARTSEADAFFLLGFDIATGLFGDPAFGGRGDTLMGPGKQKILDDLINAAAKRGFNASMKLHLGPPPLPRQK